MPDTAYRVVAVHRPRHFGHRRSRPWPDDGAENAIAADLGGSGLGSAQPGKGEDPDDLLPRSCAALVVVLSRN
jgi:hypothetical protein